MNSLVGADTGGLEGLGTELLILVGDEVDAQREVVNLRTLAAEIEDADLGVGDTTVEPRLRVRLEEIAWLAKVCSMLSRDVSFFSRWLHFSMGRRSGGVTKHFPTFPTTQRPKNEDIVGSK